MTERSCFYKLLTTIRRNCSEEVMDRIRWLKEPGEQVDCDRAESQKQSARALPHRVRAGVLGAVDTSLRCRRTRNQTAAHPNRLRNAGRRYRRGPTAVPNPP